MTARQSLKKSGLASRTVLVADPSAAMTDLLAAALRTVGVGVVKKATTSDAAWQMLTTQRLDAAIIDLDLRPQHAAELTVRLRRSSGPNAHIPVIALSTNGSRDSLMEALRSGVTKILAKPVSGESLRIRLEAVLGDAHQDQTQFAVGHHDVTEL